MNRITVPLYTLLFVTGFALAVPNTGFASEEKAPAKKLVKAKTSKKSASKKAPAEANASAAADSEDEAKLAESTPVEYKCELGNSLVLYSHPEQPESLALRWKNKLYKLTRVGTTTGANRFENTKNGLLLIDIPSKAMLLDSLHGHQLANECKSTTSKSK